MTARHAHYRNNYALYDVASIRRKFISDVRKLGPKYKQLDVTGTGTPCGLFPTCRKSAVEARVYGTYTEFLCEFELKELR